jgi:hypothetical protein
MVAPPPQATARIGLSSGCHPRDDVSLGHSGAVYMWCSLLYICLILLLFFVSFDAQCCLCTYSSVRSCTYVHMFVFFRVLRSQFTSKFLELLLVQFDSSCVALREVPLASSTRSSTVSLPLQASSSIHPSAVEEGNHGGGGIQSERSNES